MYWYALLAGRVSVGAWSGVNLGLCAVNMAEVSGQVLPAETRAEIYATAALSVKMAFPAALQFMAVSEIFLV